MVDREVFDQRLAKLEECLGRLAELAGRDRETVLRDPGLLAQLERWMHLAAEASIDMAQHLIAARGWRTPETNRDAFRVLEEEGVLRPELARRMEDWAGLRNVLVHLYLAIDHELLFDALSDELEQLRDYAVALRRTLGD